MVHVTIILYSHGDNTMVVSKYTREFVFIYTTSHSYLAHLNSIRQPLIRGTTDLNSIIQQLLVQGLNSNHQTWPMQPMCQAQSNTGDHTSSQVAPIQVAPPTHEDPEDPSSSPNTSRSDTFVCSMGRLWRMAYNMEQHKQDEELDQLKDAWWQLKDDVEYLVKELRTDMEQLKKEQMPSRKSQHDFHTSSPHPTRIQVAHKRGQHKEANRNSECLMLQESVQVQEEKKEHHIYKLSLRLQGKVFHNRIVDTHSDYNSISRAAFLEVGFTPLVSQDEEEDDQSIVVGCLKGVCVQVVGSEEQ